MSEPQRYNLDFSIKSVASDYGDWIHYSSFEAYKAKCVQLTDEEIDYILECVEDRNCGINDTCCQLKQKLQDYRERRKT